MPVAPNPLSDKASPSMKTPRRPSCQPPRTPCHRERGGCLEACRLSIDLRLPTPSKKLMLLYPHHNGLNREAGHIADFTVNGTEARLIIASIDMSHISQVPA